MAIDFCKEHDDMDLWNELINQSLDRPEIMTKLLDGIAGFINPEILVNKIKMGQCIPGLKDSLIKMLCDLRLQVSIQDGCNDILVGDYFNLHDRHVRCQQKAVYISNDNICGLCQKDIVINGKSIKLIRKFGKYLYFVCSIQIHQKIKSSHSIVVTFSMRCACPTNSISSIVRCVNRKNHSPGIH